LDDEAEIVCRVIEHRSRGTLNIATGEVYSFRDIAERVAAMAKPVVAVRGTPRQREMPHGGYRPSSRPAAALLRISAIRRSPMA
jgi:UDP-glucose 4-epimerase